MGKTTCLRKNCLVVEAYLMVCRRLGLTEEDYSYWRATSPHVWDYQDTWIRAFTGKAPEKAAAQNEIHAKNLFWLLTKFDHGHRMSRVWSWTGSGQRGGRRRYRGTNAPLKRSRRRRRKK